jgi:hypothetical protein
LYDVYRKKADPSERMATRPGAGLPRHVDPDEWELMPAGTSQITDDAEEDIEARGFCYFKLV